MKRDPDCNRSDLDEDGEPEDFDLAECCNTFELQEEDEDDEN